MGISLAATHWLKSRKPWVPIAGCGCLSLVLTLAAATLVPQGHAAACAGGGGGAIHAIVVPGGGQLHDGTEPPHMRARLDAARRRWAAAASPKPLIVCLSAGTPHKPNPRDARGFDAKEATASARYLLAGGVPAAHILEEALSLDTIGNAVYLRLLHTEVLGLRRLLVVNNGWHMPRTRAIFDKVFALPFGEPGARGGAGPVGCDEKYHLEYETVEDALPADALEARLAREAQSLAQWLQTARRFRTLGELHRWLHFEHGAYATARLTKEPEKLDPVAMKTY